jgi:alpha-beta hydrolase superfamily lysophospholipase
VTALSWEHWVERYTNRGYTVIARGWPGLESSIDELRHDPSALVDEVRAADAIDHCATIIEELDRPQSSWGIRSAALLPRCC